MYQNRIQALVGWWLTRSFGFGIDTDRYLLVDLTAEIRRMFLVGSNLLVSSTLFPIIIFFASRFRTLHGHENLLNYHTIVVISMSTFLAELFLIVGVFSSAKNISEMEFWIGVFSSVCIRLDLI